MRTVITRRHKTTAHQLVKYWYGHSRMCQAAVESAIFGMMLRGWCTAFIPRPHEWNRKMVFIPQQDEYAAIIRYVDQNSVGVVPRGLIESRTDSSIEDFSTGILLASIGIGITSIEGNNIHIRGTSHGFAMIASQTRRHVLEQMKLELLVHCVTGKHMHRRLWDDDLRLRMALAFDEFSIDVPGVLNGDIESDIQSRWHFKPLPPPPEPPCLHCDSPFPPAPDPTPIDPNVPPF